MKTVVGPAPALGDAHPPPLLFGEDLLIFHFGNHVSRDNHVPVLEVVVVVPL